MPASVFDVLLLVSVTYFGIFAWSPSDLRHHLNFEQAWRWSWVQIPSCNADVRLSFISLGAGAAWQVISQ